MKNSLKIEFSSQSENINKTIKELIFLFLKFFREIEANNMGDVTFYYCVQHNCQHY
jgi:hypothetical protein